MIVDFNDALNFDVIFNNAQQMDVTFREDTFDGDFLEGVIEGDYTGSYTVTPTKSTQTLGTVGKTMSWNVTVNPIPSEYIIPSGTIDISENGSYDIVDYASASVNVLPTLQAKSVTASASGDTVLQPDEGYDGLSIATVTIPGGSYSAGYQSGYTESQWYFTPNASVTASGWLDQGTVYGTSVAFSIISSGTSVTPSTTSQTVGGQNYMMQSAITVDPIPSEFIVPTGTLSITQNGTEDVTQYSGVSVNVQPTLQTKSSTYTPAETQITDAFTADDGYDGLGEVDITIDPIPSQYIIPSGTLSITSNSTYDVTQYADVDVSVEGGGGNLQSKTVNVTNWGSTVITPDDGYDGLTEATANVPKASYSLSTYGYFNFDGGNSKWALTHWIDTSSAGWLSSGTVYGNTVYYSAIQQGTKVTPTTASQYVGGANYMMQSSVVVEAIPSEYIIPSGTFSATSNSTYDITQYASVDVNVQTNLQSKSVTLTSQATTILPDEGYDGLASVSAIARLGTKLIGATKGYYTENGETKWKITPFDEVTVSGWFDVGSSSLSPTVFSTVASNQTITPTETSQTIGGEQYLMRGSVTVAGISSNYIGTNIPRKSSADLFYDEGFYIAPSGYYSDYALVEPQLQSSSVTPTETAQSIRPTGSNIGFYVVDVGAIPSNYVGTGIGRRDEDDILFNDGMVGVTSGYYQSNTVKQIPSASIYGGYDAVVTPSITVNASGLITAGILEEQDFAFCFGSGWVNTSASTDIRVQGYNTLQLTVGDSIGYGITDGTIPRAGIAKVGSAII